MSEQATDKSILLQRRLAALRDSYASRLPHKMKHIASLFQTYTKDEDNEILLALRQAVHKLKGSGATYGFDSISASANRFETSLISLIQKETNAPTREELTEHVKALQNAIDESVCSA